MQKDPFTFRLIGLVQALLWTLGQGAGFTPDVQEAWAAVYGLLAKTMKDAASPAPA